MILPSQSIEAPETGGRSWDKGRPSAAVLVMALVVLALGACSTGPDGRRIGSNPPVQGGYKVGVPYQINGVWYYPKENFKYDRTGIASWYGHPFHGHTSASGERYDMTAMTAAHKTLPMPSLVEVTNLDNGRRAVLRINDRGPFVSGRIIDVSRAAARKLGFRSNGTARVRVRILEQESRRMKQLALANMNNRALEVASRRQRQAESRPQVAAKPPEYQPAARPAEAGSYTPAASSRPVTVARAPAPKSPKSPKSMTPKPKPYVTAQAATARPAAKRGGIRVTDLPPAGGGATAGGPGVYRPQPDPQPRVAAAKPRRVAGLGRVAGRRDHVVRPQASAVHAVRPAARAAIRPRPRSRSLPRSARTGDLPGRIYVQAGAFRDRTNAHRLRRRLATLGSVQIVPVRIGGARYFRVRVGPVTSASQGNRLLARVVDAGYPRAQIVID
jgi:rare lipoprotein A